jgi:HD superfamily phosphohydrolase
MSKVAFADVVHQTIYFSREIESEALVLDLIDTSWVQRLRDISQTGNGSLVYMFLEHSRFGHSLGVAYLANHLMDQLQATQPELVKPYRTAISAAALLHDIGHIAPGSHAAYKTWFPKRSDCHEAVSVRIIREETEISGLLQKYGSDVTDLVCKILGESPDIPPWVWEIISGAGWNVDRGNWCFVDSVMAGVSYGRYNIAALIESMVIDRSGHLAVKENRLDAMLHFAIARHSMYRQVYQHRVLLSAEKLNLAIVERARDLKGALSFADDAMQQVLASEDPLPMNLRTIFAMRESWWRYHLMQWQQDPDAILRDLAGRLLQRKLFKTLRARNPEELETIYAEALAAVTRAGFDPRYYLHRIQSMDMNSGELDQPMMVQMDDGSLQSLQQSEPLWNAMMIESRRALRNWVALPAEAKDLLGRKR